MLASPASFLIAVNFTGNNSSANCTNNEAGSKSPLPFARIGCCGYGCGSDCKSNKCADCEGDKFLHGDLLYGTETGLKALLPISVEVLCKIQHERCMNTC